MWPFKRKKKEERPIIITYDGKQMLVVERQHIHCLKEVVKPFLENLVGLSLDDIPVDEEIIYAIYYFDGTELFSGVGPFCEIDQAVCCGVERFLNEVEGDDVLTATFMGPYGINTLVGIKISEDNRLAVSSTSGNC